MEKHKISLNCPACHKEGRISIICCVLEGEGSLLEYHEGDPDPMHLCYHCGQKYRLKTEPESLLGIA